jgi:hypothetical protein
MSMRRDLRSVLASILAAATLLLAAGEAHAQLQSGNLFGTVTDEAAAALPGVTVTLTGSIAPVVQVTDGQGQFRFLGLGPGSYQLKAELEGFSTVEYPNISINIGRNTAIEVTLASAVEDVITVTAESPLLDERRISTGNTVSQTELEKIPTARDPWAILQSTPGVLTDRINVGGNESGQQSAYVGPGSGGDQAVWSVDGVVITDMAALGSTPAYFDFDSFEEMQVTTGGSDSTIATGGVVLNIVTKRGTNEWRGTGRYFLADDSWQSDINVDDGDLGKPGPHNQHPTRAPQGATQPVLRQGNRIVSVKDYGVELGGPIVRDRLWIWGSYGMQEVDLLTIADVSDFTELETANLKLNAQIAANNSATVFALNSDKVKLGRGASPFRPQPTTWNQSKFGDDPTAAKIEDTHIFSSSFYLTGLYSIVNGGFQLAPQAGTGLGATATLNPQAVWGNSFFLYQSSRPQEQVKADASAFFNTGSLSHELKFGASLREAEVDSLTRWPGAGFYLTSDWFGGDFALLYAQRDAFPSAKNEYTSVYLQDTLSIGNLTANVGLRYDLQSGETLTRTVQANPVFPDILPSVTVPGVDAGFEWESITPRLGLTYALGEDRKTLLRASYSQFADQLGTGTTYQLNQLYLGGYVYLMLDPSVGTRGNITRGDVVDQNGDGRIDREDVLGGTAGMINMNPYTLGALRNNTVDPSLDAPTTDELLFSVEHALLPEFVVGLNLTYRHMTDLLEAERLVFDCADGGQTCGFDQDRILGTGRVHRRSDYVLVETPTGSGATARLLPDGTPYTVQQWHLRPGVMSRGGTHLENGDREQEYMGGSLTFNKRLANRWMMRGNVSYSDWEWSSVPQSELEDPVRALGGGFEGDPVMQGSGLGSGAKGAVYINSQWSYSVNGLYQVAPDAPWGFNFAGSLTGREGYPLPYFERFDPGVRAGIPGFSRVQVVPNDEYRLDDIHILDLRLEKEFTFSDFGLTLGVDVFNALNDGTVLQRNHRLRVGPSAVNPLAPASDFVTEVTSPRIFRLGARLSFR